MSLLSVYIGNLGLKRYGSSKRDLCELEAKESLSIYYSQASFNPYLLVDISGYGLSGTMGLANIAKNRAQKIVI